MIESMNVFGVACAKQANEDCYEISKYIYFAWIHRPGYG